MANASLIVRLTRVCVGLVTIWCLGCSGYESILTSLLGGKAGAAMACGGESRGGSQMRASSGDQTGQASGPAVSAQSESRSFDCGCGGTCHAPSMQAASVSRPTAPIPVTLQFAPTAPESLTRAPLLPPPEFAA